MKLQASRPISPKNLQSQTSSPTKNRLALSRLGILHGRLSKAELREQAAAAFLAWREGQKAKDK
jgi:hypothetical protein